MTTHITFLAHNDAAFILGVRPYPVTFTFGTVAGYAAECNRDAITAVATEAAKGRPIAWACPNATVLCGDLGYYAAREAREATYPRLNLGDVVELEGRQYILRPDYNHNVRLDPISAK